MYKTEVFLADGQAAGCRTDIKEIYSTAKAKTTKADGCGTVNEKNNADTMMIINQERNMYAYARNKKRVCKYVGIQANGAKGWRQRGSRQ